MNISPQFNGRAAPRLQKESGIRELHYDEYGAPILASHHRYSRQLAAAAAIILQN